MKFNQGYATALQRGFAWCRFCGILGRESPRTVNIDIRGEFFHEPLLFNASIDPLINSGQINRSSRQRKRADRFFHLGALAGCHSPLSLEPEVAPPPPPTSQMLLQERGQVSKTPLMTMSNSHRNYILKYFLDRKKQPETRNSFSS